jgi:hypothetical protein
MTQERRRRKIRKAAKKSPKQPVSGQRRAKPAARSTRSSKPAEDVRIRQLDPQAVCGPRTQVQQLFRVQDLLDGKPTVHLVYFDRHGWYCEHGPTCRAVDHVRRALPKKPHS